MTPTRPAIAICRQHGHRWGPWTFGLAGSQQEAVRYCERSCGAKELWGGNLQSEPPRYVEDVAPPC